MTVVVSMPTYQTPQKLLRRAVESVLAQTHDDLLLVLVEDGEPAPHVPIDDDRLVRIRLPHNRGRYFSDAVVTEAIADRPDLVWIVHDADDWSEPQRLERLLPALEDGAAVAPYWRHQHNRDFVQEPSRGRLLLPKQGFVHLAHWCSGAYTSERVQRAGGIHPGFRVGFDTLFVRLLAMTGPVGIGRHPDYHWCRRSSGSLTTSEATRFGSSARATAKKRLSALDDAAWLARSHGEDVAAVVRADVEPDLAREVDRQARRLRRALGWDA